MEELVLSAVTGLVMPMVMLVVKRRYEDRPDDWEKVFIWVASVALAIGGFVLSNYLLRLLPEADPTTIGIVDLGRFLCVGVACWSVLLGGYAGMEAWWAFKKASGTPQTPEQ